jgi:hypothetical protein
VEVLSPLPNRYLHQDPTFTLKLAMVEVVQIFSILDEWMVTTSSYNQLAIILQF